MLVDIGSFISGKSADNQPLDDHYFCDWLARRVGVAAGPGSSFFHEPVHHYIRFHYAKQAATLDAAGERLLTLASRWEEDHA